MYAAGKKNDIKLHVYIY